MKKPYNDFAPRNGSKNDKLNMLIVGLTVGAMITFCGWVYVVMSIIS